jgi:hypothetical protein
MSSIINNDYKGLILFVGALFACLFCIIFGILFGFSYSQTKPAICTTITIGQYELSSLPNSQTIFGYVFSYLYYFIEKNKYVSQNYPILVFFPIIAIIDMYWNKSNKCFDIISLLISFIFGLSMGWLWAKIIDSLKMTNLQYFYGFTNNETCSVNGKGNFECKYHKNGQLFSNNLGDSIQI